MLSITIPTKNRPAFLLRQLRYYVDVGFEGCICIGDSSDPSIADSTETAIDGFREHLNIIYRKFPELGEAQTTHKLLELVQTPYAVWSGDDDFLVPNGLEICVLFLESNPEYNAVHGKGIALQLNSSMGDRVTASRRYNQPIVEGRTASDRLLHWLDSGGDVHYSVHRIESRLRMYKYAPLMTEHVLAAAEMPCLMSVIQGAIKELDCLTLVRGIHEGRYAPPDHFDNIINPEWCNTYYILHNSLIKELMLEDDITFEQARKIITHVNKTRLLKSVNKHLNIPEGKIYSRIRKLWQISHMSLKSGLKTTVKTIPGIGKVIDLIRNNRWRVRSNDFSLSVLLHPSSRYYEDFMPVYEAISKQSVTPK